MKNDDLFNYLVATGKLDEFLGNEDEDCNDKLDDEEEDDDNKEGEDDD